MGKYDAVAARITELVGGKENINALTHCVNTSEICIKGSRKGR